MFDRLALSVRHFTGNAVAFCLAVNLILIWAAVGPVFNFSDTWQLVVNTSTTIITFLMVFLIQNAQNHQDAHFERLIKQQTLLLEAIRDLMVREEEQLIDIGDRLS